MSVSDVEAFTRRFADFVASKKLQRDRTIQANTELVLVTTGRQFDEQVAQLGPFGEGNPAPVFLLRSGGRNCERKVKGGGGNLLRSPLYASTGDGYSLPGAPARASMPPK